MRLQDRLKRDWRFWRGLSRTLKRVKSIGPESDNLLCDDLQSSVDSWRNRRALTFEGTTLTYGEMDALANRYANWGRSQNLRRGQTVALFMPNRMEYFPIWYGLSKIGVVTALINNQLVGQALAHCLNISGATHVILDSETVLAFEAAQSLLSKPMIQWVHGLVHGTQRDMVQTLRSCSQLPPDRSVRSGMTASDPVLYIYTSGTTGLPKAAKISHMRAQLYMRGFAGATGATLNDRVYITLPLYHATGGLCGLGVALLNGGSAVLKTRFSATRFWPDVVEEGATMFVYIGELCRYLVNHPPSEDERRHKLRLAFGNGLSADVWGEMRPRFHVPDVLEFYGSTEGNVSMFNFDGKVGAIGRTPKWLGNRYNFKLVQFDLETEQPVRSISGLCVAAGTGQIGECLGKIAAHDPRAEFTGYVDKAASDKKILRDVFEKGDAWFRTGDLMQMDADGYYYFIDRIGDTFRWKGENVSTGEVTSHLQTAPGVLEAIVYGVAVPGAEGRAGMAGLVVSEAFDLKVFSDYVSQALPSYAQPVFLRLLPTIATTGTFKYRKVDLVRDGFSPDEIKDKVFYRTPAKGYVRLTRPTYAKILDQGVKL
ncbi:MAG: long-chain-acyl-CoA synthetase [Alphaproteobacteria bacterium]